MATTYSTRVTASGGRRGEVRSDDGILDLKLAMPKEMGGLGGATNPEQLFAAGYAACFQSATMFLMRGKDIKVDNDMIEVAATVGLDPVEPVGFTLTVTLDVTIKGLPQETAEGFVEAAHQMCPYSKAIRGNVPVTLNVRTVA
ncbi:Ohr subfamily peroxiredoxin [Acuticoccus sediminis]|uniref:Ohr subfamily peroxiredoxin n=1 Tax=Acuticoccus sediminis TaxID=2184697 RepID=A0A8B2NUF8_9HYPH|nr:organic hydroperoxide resistance protein [Acuticoccus sediminis]RAI02963.1 Ohr subfamily peroxiredoxin [Acuticoccus sediminis]